MADLDMDNIDMLDVEPFGELTEESSEELALELFDVLET